MKINWILAAILSVSVCGCTSPQLAKTEPTPGPTKSPELDGIVTAQEYSAISLKANYVDVFMAIGLGTELSASQAGDVTTRTLIWKNPDGSSMTATFEDGILIEKSQSGILQ